MKTHFKDILDRIPEPPTWWDENGTPRYGKFSPELVADFYAAEAVLLDISCQGCGRRFSVAMSKDRYSLFPSLRDRIKEKTIHYGDPPNVHCCAAGASMNCWDLRVLEYWRHLDVPPFRWKRDKKYEIKLPDWIQQ